MARRPATRSALLGSGNGEGDPNEGRDDPGVQIEAVEAEHVEVEKNTEVAQGSLGMLSLGSQQIPDSGGTASEKTIADKDVINPDLQFTSEDAFRKSQKVNSVAAISALRLKPHSISRLRIPLCRLAAMPMIRSALQCDLTRLEQEFVHGYRDGSSVFYVSVTNEQGEIEQVIDAEKDAWGAYWNEENEIFNATLRATVGLENYQFSKFFVCDGNHRLLAWSSYISNKHANDRDWHISVDSIILETKGRINDVMHAMHDINQQTENSFIKTNLVHTLYHVQKYGVLPLDKFAEHLSPAEMAQCTSSTRKTWFSMSVEVFTSFIFRYEIAAAADLAVQKYREDTGEEEQSPEGIMATMRSTTKEITSRLIQKLNKLTAVANLEFGSDFLKEIEKHWTRNIVLEMTLEKLQLIATANISSHYKLRWIKWWNCSTETRKARWFPVKPVGENELKVFLAKACWYAWIEELGFEMFDDIVKKDQLPLTMESSQAADTFPDYLEGWRIRVWDQAFLSYFKGQNDGLKKGDDFRKHQGTDLLVKRVLFRYFMYELLEKGAIAKRDLPLFLSLWLDPSSEQCMYSQSQLQWWTSLHLKAGAWYLDCPPEFTPESELELKNSINSRSTEVAADEFPGLDENTRAKAVKRREEADKKITLKNSEAVSKAKEKMTKKALIALEIEEAATAKKGKGKGKGMQKSQTLCARDAGSQHQRSTSRGTKRDADYMSLSDGGMVHGPLAVEFLNESEISISEFIFNFSLAHVLADPLPQVYHNIINFVDTVKGDKERFFRGVRSDKPRIDLIIADLPEGLPVLDLSVPANNIPKWNADNPALLDTVFEFADGHLHDDGALIIIYPLRAITKATLVKYGTTYSFEKIKDWWGTNWLHLASPVSASRTTQVFGIALFVRNLPGIGKSKFKFQPSPTLLGLGVNVPRDDILQNFTKRETLTMDSNSKPWRGAREKDPRFY